MSLGEKIKACRQNAGIVAGESSRIGWREPPGRYKMGGQTSPAPNTENLFKLAEILGTTVDLLLASQENRNISGRTDLPPL